VGGDRWCPPGTCAGESVPRPARGRAREQPIRLRAILRHAMSEENVEITKLLLYSNRDRALADLGLES
jgi:hypothetical protein